MNKSRFFNLFFLLTFFHLVGCVNQPVHSPIASNSTQTSESFTQNNPTSQGTAAVDPEATAARLKASQERLAEMAARLAPAGAGPDLIESYISGEFKGWDGQTVFVLDNGQIWQQSVYAYTYYYAFHPKVIIVKVDGTYKMKVDGVDDMIFVKQLK